MARCRVPLLLALLLLLVCAAAGSPDATECSALGFNSELVLCSDCDVLEDTVREAGLTATLEVDRWRLDPYPELKGFVSRKAKAYGNFGVVYTHSYRASPTLVLKRSAEEAAADGKPAEVRVTVGNWKTDQLDAFLKEKLAVHAATAK